jgi:ribosomal protein S18 acetylase RimI-like enzyme
VTRTGPRRFRRGPAVPGRTNRPRRPGKESATGTAPSSTGIEAKAHPPPGVRFRGLSWNDFPGWVELYYSRFDEIGRTPDLGVYLRETRPTIGEEATIFSGVYRGVEQGHAVVSVAELGGRVVGVCSVHHRGTHLEDRHLGVLAIAVHPEHRGRGIGRGLLHHALEACRGRFLEVQLSVVAHNDRAIRLYRDAGFEVCGRWPRAFRRGARTYDEILMSRPMT